MEFAFFLLTLFIHVASEGVCTGISPVKIVFLIDESFSVLPGPFKNQLELGNTVLDTVRKFYEDHGSDPSAVEFGVVSFSSGATVRKDMGEDDGSRIDFSQTPGGTNLKKGLEKAKEVLVQGSPHSLPVIWLLTDGEPTDDLRRIELLKQYRSGELSGITVLGVFLPPAEEVLLGLGVKVMQALTCADADDECTDRYISEKIGVSDFQDVKTKAEDMMNEVLKEITATCIAIPLLLLIIVIIIVILACCTWGGKKALAHIMEEEEGPMMQQEVQLVQAKQGRRIDVDGTNGKVHYQKRKTRKMAGAPRFHA